MAKKKRKLSAYNRHVQREMKKGKSMKAAARSWKKGSKPKPRRVGSKIKTKPKARAKTGGRKVAKGGFNTQKLMKYVRLAALAAPAINAVLRPEAASPRDKLAYAVRSYTGYDLNRGTFDWKYLGEGWTPYLAAVVATYGIPKLAGILRGI